MDGSDLLWTDSRCSEKPDFQDLDHGESDVDG